VELPDQGATEISRTFPPSPFWLVRGRRSNFVPLGCPKRRSCLVVPDVVNQLLATEAALDKLGARGISVVEAEQTI
jgi:hypothetical protein